MWKLKESLLDPLHLIEMADKVFFLTDLLVTSVAHYAREAVFMCWNETERWSDLFYSLFKQLFLSDCPRFPISTVEHSDHGHIPKEREC